MNAHDLAKEMTEKEADNVIGYWENNDSSKLATFKRLVSLGDSKILAVATVMTMEKKDSEIYQKAYYS